MTAMTAPTTGLTPTEERNMRAITDVLRYWNSQDVEGILTFYDDEIVWTNVALEKVFSGKDAVRAHLTELMHAFPDLSFEVIDKFVREDRVSERWYLRGTHRGTFMGVPPTGRSIELAGISMVQMRDGKFLSDWFLFDAALGMRQMGLLPPLKLSETKVMQAALWAAIHRKITGAVVGVGAVFAFLVRWVTRRSG